MCCAQLELQSHDTLAKHWRHLAKKEAKAVKDGVPGHVPVAQRAEATFLPALLADFLQVSAIGWVYVGPGAVCTA